MTTLCAPGDFVRLGNIGQANPVELASTVSAIAENHCCRHLILAARTEVYEPGTTRVIRLKGYPVQSIDRICTDLSNVCTVQALANPWRATVEVATVDGSPYSTPIEVNLAITSGGSTTLETLTLAAYPTAASLVAAINGLSGWSASLVPGMGDCPSTEILPTTGALGAVACQAQLLAYATTLEQYELKPSTGKLTLYQIRPDPYQYPNRTFAPLSPATKVQVIYTAGYNGDPANGPVTSPADLVEACVEIGRAVLDAREVSGVFDSVSLGNTSYKVGDVVAIPDAAIRTLSRYVDRRF